MNYVDAPICVVGYSRKVLPVRQLTDVTMAKGRKSAYPTDRSYDLLACIVPDVCDNHPRTLACEPASCSSANSARSSGYDRNLAVEAGRLFHLHCQVTN